MKVEIKTKGFFGTIVKSDNKNMSELEEINLDGNLVDINDSESLEEILDILDKYLEDFNEQIAGIEIWFPTVTGVITDEMTHEINDIKEAINTKLEELDIAEEVKDDDNSNNVENIVRRFIDETYPDKENSVKDILFDIIKKYSEWVIKQ